MPFLERLIDRLGIAMPEIEEIDATPESFVQEQEQRPESVGCAFCPIEDDDISIADAVEVLHREARKIEAIG